jgi:serine O-acetyltransferase
MQLINLESNRLPAYVKAQLNHLFPTGNDPSLAQIDLHMPMALRRLGRCIDEVKMWKPGQFDVLHSSQYCLFLYFLANTLWRAEGASTACTKLFGLNKALNAIDCFYEIELPEVFFIGHSVGIVLAKATYANYLVLYQNSTIGKNHGEAPILEERVVLYPNSAVIGASVVRQGSVISQGVSVINQTTQANALVFRGVAGGLTFRKDTRCIPADFFRGLPH